MSQEDKFIVTQRKPAVGKSSVTSVRLPDTTIEQLETIAARTGTYPQRIDSDVY